MPLSAPARAWARYLVVPDELPGQTQGHHRSWISRTAYWTGWFDNTVALDGWGEDDEDFKIRQRYQFTVRNDAQRHAVNMSVRVLDREETIDGETSNKLTCRCPALCRAGAEPVLSLRHSQLKPANSTSSTMVWACGWVWTTTN